MRCSCANAVAARALRAWLRAARARAAEAESKAGASNPNHSHRLQHSSCARQSLTHRMSGSDDDDANQSNHRDGGKEASTSGEPRTARTLGKRELRKVADKLFSAAEDDEVKKLKKILERKYPDVEGLLDLRDEKGRTALHLAARHAALHSLNPQSLNPCNEAHQDGYLTVCLRALQVWGCGSCQLPHQVRNGRVVSGGPACGAYSPPSHKTHTRPRPLRCFVRLHRSCGADIEATDRKGNTPAHFAAEIAANFPDVRAAGHLDAPTTLSRRRAVSVMPSQ